ncbi:MAG TPA: hypothetical protein VMS02_02815 [Solirubrobacteraceae bacterium]|nr:hypothetical protein [Solirubrobacteraceae bacterium]
MRVLGGVAIALRAAPQTPPALLRTSNDLDLAVEEGEGRRAGAVLGESGLVALSERFNAVHGHRRLVFVESRDAAAKVDVFVGDLEMCHVVPLRRRLERDPLTLSPTDLLLSKGQIARFSAKDRLDLYCLLWNHAVHADAAPDGDLRDAAPERPVDALGAGRVEADYIAALCARDWGWWRTLGANLAACRQGLADLVSLGPDERALVDTRLQTLEQAIEAAPKSLRWRARSRLGDRMRWYEEPEEIEALAVGPAATGTADRP